MFVSKFLFSLLLLIFFSLTAAAHDIILDPGSEVTIDGKSVQCRDTSSSAQESNLPKCILSESMGVYDVYIGNRQVFYGDQLEAILFLNNLKAAGQCR